MAHYVFLLWTVERIMANEDKKPDPQLLDEDTYVNVKNFLLDIGGQVNGCPLIHFIATIKHVKSLADTLSEDKRKLAIENLDRFEKIANSLLPFQQMVEEVAKEAGVNTKNPQKPSNIITFDKKIIN